MTAQTAPDSTTALTVTQAGEPWEPKTLEVLDQYPETEFNVLVPTQAVRQVNPFLVPDIQTVQLHAVEGSRDVYHDSQMKTGHYAPTASALRKIADTAGINEVESRRTDDGKNPDVVEWTVAVERQLPTGQTVRAHGTKRVDLTAISFASDAHRKRTRQYMLENAQTKALNRAVRSLLSLHGSYTLAQLAKPFAVLRWVPNMAHPAVQRAFLGQLTGSTQALFGPGDSSTALPAAATPAQLETSDVVTAPEAPEEGEPAPDDPVQEPDWTKTSDEATPATADDAMPRILSALKERAAASKLEGKATDAQREQLKVATRGLGAGVVMGVLGHVFEIGAPGDITAAQAEAILDEFESRGATFANSMREAAEAIDRSLPQ